MLNVLVWYWNAGLYPLLFVLVGGKVIAGREVFFIAIMLWCIFCYFRALGKTIDWISEGCL